MELHWEDYPPPPKKIPQPKHHFYCILISTFLGVIRKTQAFAAAGTGWSRHPRFAVSGSDELGVILQQPGRYPSVGPYDCGGPRQGVISSASASLQPTYWLLISVIALTTRKRHRSVQGDWH